MCAVNRAGIVAGISAKARLSANQMRGVSDPRAAGGAVDKVDNKRVGGQNLLSTIFIHSLKNFGII